MKTVRWKKLSVYTLNLNDNVLENVCIIFCDFVLFNAIIIMISNNCIEYVTAFCWKIANKFYVILFLKRS